MRTEQLSRGKVVIDVEGAVVHEGESYLVVEIPVQYRYGSKVEVGSVYLGSEAVSVLVREARRWGDDRARIARSKAKS